MFILFLKEGRIGVLRDRPRLLGVFVDFFLIFIFFHLTPSLKQATVFSNNECFKIYAFFKCLPTAINVSLYILHDVLFLSCMPFFAL